MSSYDIYCNNVLAHTSGEINPIGSKAPEFVLTASDLSLVALNDYAGQAVLLNIFMSLDTPVCLATCEEFEATNQEANNILCVSMDLPFALARIEEEKQFKNIRLLSDFRNRTFGEAFNLTIVDGPLAGLLARDVIVLDKQHNIVYQYLCREVTEPPDLSEALQALRDCQ